MLQAEFPVPRILRGRPNALQPFASGSVEGPSIAGSLQSLRGCPLHLH